MRLASPALRDRALDCAHGVARPRFVHDTFRLRAPSLPPQNPRTIWGYDRTLVTKGVFCKVFNRLMPCQGISTRPIIEM